MPPKINAAFVEKVLVAFIRDEFGRCGCPKAIVGLSGGLDSAVCAALAARALGPRNVLGLIMPYGRASREDVRDAAALAWRATCFTKSGLCRSRRMYPPSAHPETTVPSALRIHH